MYCYVYSKLYNNLNKKHDSSMKNKKNFFLKIFVEIA